MKRSLLKSAALATSAALGLLLSSCGPAAFDASSFLDGVRILASSASEPYAKPGDSVTVKMLDVDARPVLATNAPMRTFWVPFVCEDPTDDLYYDCFAPGVNGSNSSATSGSGSLSSILKPGVDLTPVLTAGDSYTFTMPTDAITKHVTASGVDPYGLVVLFNAACAGHLEYVPPSSSSPQGGIPLGCYDENHNALGADDFVFGITRVYAYADRTNANPVITSVAFNGTVLDSTSGVTMPHCTKAKRAECDDQDFVTNVPASSAEPNPADVDPSTGTERHEQVYASYYATFGDLDSDISLLYDPTAGMIDAPIEKYKAPSAPGEGTMYVVVHDNRGGASWTSFPLHVQ